MNAREKINVWWIGAAILAGLIVAGEFASNFVFLIVVFAAIAWATRNRHIR